jgi:hypothetical protein
MLRMARNAPDESSGFLVPPNSKTVRCGDRLGGLLKLYSRIA